MSIVRNMPFPIFFLPLFQNDESFALHNFSKGNEFDLKDNTHATQQYFIMKGFAPRTCFQTEVKSTLKWLIKWSLGPSSNGN